MCPLRVRTKAGIGSDREFVFVKVFLYHLVDNFSITLEICGKSDTDVRGSIFQRI